MCDLETVDAVRSREREWARDDAAADITTTTATETAATETSVVLIRKEPSCGGSMML